MSLQKTMIDEFAWDEAYRVSDFDDVMTPALVVYPEFIASNIERTLALLDDDASRWRVHIKTAKLGYTLRMMGARGIRNFKCATTLELLVACECGAADILLAYPSVGANARRVREIADQFPEVRVSVLVENEEQATQWRGSRLGVFVDINPGMNRTGIEEGHGGVVIELVRAIVASGLEFRGLHYYDGHLRSTDEAERTKSAHHGYHRLMGIEKEIERIGIRVPEVITAGTPTLPCAASFAEFRNASFVHRISPGTVIYSDASMLEQLPEKYGYRPAVLVMTRVVSHPREGIVTCDAGHKTVSADSGIPTCVVVGHPELTPLTPSEEHLPMQVASGATGPQVGDVLYLLPRHICPTVNNFDDALLVRSGKIEALERVTARGRETPLLRSRDAVASAG
jgi:D-serine deaminase-like pyridoxal phosphate-dependent protein